MTGIPASLAASLSDRYRIERELGAGGMATVFLAHDLKHHRNVALKVLRPELAAVIGAERFLHEITTTANLQHPHILGLFDSGQVDGTVFYVMPLVQGESLRDRLTREKQLPVEDAVRIGREVASALDYAHRQGVIHRDIKPENILLHDGSAVVADFGIALAASRTGGTRMTETGMSLGTPHYMSPEQAMGERELGPRSDIYALGCVCYEMLCGEPPFTGPTPQAIVARAITDPPRSVRSQRPSVPDHVEAAILQSLEKLPADRFSTAAAFGEALGSPAFTRTMSSAPPPVSRADRRWKAVASGLGALATLLLVALLLTMQRPGDQAVGPRPPIRFEIAIPDSIAVNGIVLTRDGSRLLVLGENSNWIYTLADQRLTPLDIPELRAYSSGADFSPGGERIAFVHNNALKIVPATGGNPRTMADTVASVKWAADGYLYVRRRIDKRHRFARVPEAGGPPEELFVAPDTGSRVDGLALPGGRAAIVSVETPSTFKVDLALLDLRTKEVRPIANPVATGIPVEYTEGGHLIFYARDAMHAVPFDVDRLEFTGPPVPFLPGAPLGATAGAGIFAYTLTPPAGPALMNRRGVRREIPGAIAPGTWTFSTSASPTGDAFAFWRYEAASDRWDTYVYRLPSGPLVRLSTEAARRNGRPTWSRDGSSVFFVAEIDDHGIIYRTAADGSTQPERVMSRPGSIEDFSFVPDETRMVVEESGRGLVLASTTAGDSGITVVDQREQPQRPRVSRDGRWLSYTAVAFGRREVFVRPLAGGSSRWQVSRSGGTSAFWSRSGRELFFLTEDSLYSAPVNTAASSPIGEARALFPVPPFSPRSAIDVLPGDSVFVMIATALDAVDRIAVMVNFDESIRALNTPPATGRR